MTGEQLALHKLSITVKMTLSQAPDVEFSKVTALSGVYNMQMEREVC